MASLCVALVAVAIAVAGLPASASAGSGPLPSAATSAIPTPAAPTPTVLGPKLVRLRWLAVTPTAGDTVTGYTIQAIDPIGYETIPFYTWRVGLVQSATLADMAPYAYQFRVRAEGSTPSEWSPLSAWILPPFDTLEQFISRQYLDFEGRAPTATETYQGWNELRSGNRSPGGVIEIRSGSVAWGRVVDPLVRLYYAALDRPPTTAGLGPWVAKRRAGMPLDAVGAGFAATSEFTAKYGALNSRGFVNRVFQNTLGQPGPATTVELLIAGLERGYLTRGQVLVLLAEDRPHQARRLGEVNTIDVFYGMLRRVPTSSELARFRLSSGRADVAQFLLRSTAYYQRHGG